MLKFKILITILLLSSLIFPQKIFAEDDQKFITVVNPVRISIYNKNPSESLRNEYKVIKENKISATWLLTYDAIQSSAVQNVVKSMDKSQEFGIFLEVTPNFAGSSGVLYHQTGSWHHAASVFLSGYTQGERKLLIDNVFAAFKEKFGYFPKSVGSWWTDAFSLSYMKQKYGITANLVCSDQFSTDGYQIWGQPWALPYYPSKFHPAVPAQNLEIKLGVVNIQWAPRDPLLGYKSSLYSTQDYTLAPRPQSIDYFRKLVKFYASYGQITLGLESDLDPSVYVTGFASQMKVVIEMPGQNVRIVTMSEFADWYKQKYSGISPSSIIESDDLLGSGAQSYWYSGPNYRLSYIVENGQIKIRDLRIYDENLTDPYYVSPNSSFALSINIPSIISASENPENLWILPPGSEIKTLDDSVEIRGKNLKVPETIKRSDLVNLSQSGNLVKIFFKKQNISVQGINYKDYSAESIHFFKQKKFILNLLTGKGWNYFKKADFLIPQGEMYALKYLKSLQSGKILVYDHECLQCVFHTEAPPPVFQNRRGYVKNFSNKNIIYNKSVFEAKDREKGREDIKKTGAKYIYLVKFEEYKESLPFSPGDLGVEKVFSNANAEIWEIK